MAAGLADLMNNMMVSTDSGVVMHRDSQKGLLLNDLEVLHQDGSELLHQVRPVAGIL